ncbi:MAG TPA: hypothetical protein VJ752_07455 [Burkholderiaceae bacterium]|nr:hypothetical protein [Burkholderiaceae bacterium]
MFRRVFRIGAVLASLGGVLAGATSALAAPEEIKVYTDDIAEPGEHALEWQTVVARSPRTRSPQCTTVNTMGEYAYGWRDDLELGIQLPLARWAGQWRATGLFAEAQYIAPHDADDGAYWGVRAEAGYAAPLDEDKTWHAQLVGIFGWRSGPLSLALNPGFDIPLTGDDRAVRFEPAAGLSWHIDKRHAFGLEYFIEAGPLKKLLPRSQRSELLFLTADTRIAEVGLHFGIGKAMTDGASRRVVKLIAEFPL